ncbi:MAG: porin, partial [Gammaproteobacteria bacterium]
MNKKLLATAIGVALAGAMSSASAAVKVYGQVNESYDIYNNSQTSYACDTGTCHDSSGSGLSDNSSRLGFKGSEDLGGGNAFIWQIESSIDIVNGSGSLAHRNTFGGFRGDWGTLLAGNHDSAMKLADIKIMPFNNTIGDSRNIMGVSSDGTDYLNKRFKRIVAYVSPNMMGFTGYLIYVGNQNPSNHAPGNTKAGGYDVAASYSNGPIKGWVAYENQFSDVSNRNLSAFRISGSYNMNPFKVGAIYENVSADHSFAGYNMTATGNPMDRNAWGLYGMMNLGMNDIGVSYYKADSSSAGSNNGADMWVLGAYHHFSKQTS